MVCLQCYDICFAEIFKAYCGDLDSSEMNSQNGQIESDLMSFKK